MPIFALNEKIVFPPVELADERGILAIGGDLSPERLILAYSMGIFPWYSKEDPIIWWSPDPRFVLFPSEKKITKSMRQILRRKIFSITFDTVFRQVMTECQKPRKKEVDTWITDDMLEAYVRLHEMGLAHSIEAWKDGELVGGLYGISLGKCFFGESMFAKESNASKAAFITLCKILEMLEFIIIDCQVYTQHLESLGARNIPRSEYVKIIKDGLKHSTLTGKWGELPEFENDYFAEDHI